MHVDQVDTPAVLIDLTRVERNLARAQTYADTHGLRLRPHVKTHKLPMFAKMQLNLGAIGICCQKLGEAEAMADAGLADIFIPYNILGTAKLARLAALNRRVTLSVTADSAATVAGYAAQFAANAPLAVLVECDTGAGRCGVQSAAQVVALARMIADAPGLQFDGLMTYPPQGAPAQINTGLPPEVISTGGTPDLLHAAATPVATEYRPGTYIYSDRMQVAWGHGSLDDCALRVKATVVSMPTPDRAILDAGSKALAADPVPSPFDGHGLIAEFPQARITALSEEHATVDLSRCAEKPGIGQSVQVIPNHACVVTNLFDQVHLVRGDQVEQVAEITSRGGLQ